MLLGHLERNEKQCTINLSCYVQALEKQTDMTERQIQRWFRMKRNQERPSQMKRFTEAS